MQPRIYGKKNIIYYCTLDILMQPSIHGYTIGATNALFKAKSGLADVLIEIEEDKLEVYSPELR